MRHEDLPRHSDNSAASARSENLTLLQRAQSGPSPRIDGMVGRRRSAEDVAGPVERRNRHAYCQPTSNPRLPSRLEQGAHRRPIPATRRWLQCCNAVSPDRPFAASVSPKGQSHGTSRECCIAWSIRHPMLATRTWPRHLLGNCTQQRPAHGPPSCPVH